VALRRDAAGRELLTWALVKAAAAGDRVVALHVSTVAADGARISPRDSTPPSLRLLYFTLLPAGRFLTSVGWLLCFSCSPAAQEKWPRRRRTGREPATRSPPCSARTGGSASATRST
jgi:hypothetical protein